MGAYSKALLADDGFQGLIGAFVDRPSYAMMAERVGQRVNLKLKTYFDYIQRSDTEPATVSQAY